MINTPADGDQTIHLGKVLEGGYWIGTADPSRAVHITTYEDGFEVFDPGNGMADTVLLTTLPRPRSGKNMGEARTSMEQEIKIDEETNVDITRAHGDLMAVQFLIGSRAVKTLEFPNDGTPRPAEITIRLPVSVTVRNDKVDLVVNETLEKAMDYASGKEFHPLIKLGKDYAAGSVFLLSVLATFVSLFILGTHYAGLLAK